MQVTHTALHYTHELMTTFGLIHTLDFDTPQLEAELRGATSFRDPRVPHPDTRPSSFSSVTTSMTATLHRLDSGPTPRSTSTTRPVHGITTTSTRLPMDLLHALAPAAPWIALVLVHV